MRQRKRYTEEFKREAVRLAIRDGMSQAKVARDLGLNSNLLNRWVSESMRKPHSIEVSSEVVPTALDALQKKLDEVTMERDILKKALAYFAADHK